VVAPIGDGVLGWIREAGERHLGVPCSDRVLESVVFLFFFLLPSVEGNPGSRISAVEGLPTVSRLPI